MKTTKKELPEFKNEMEEREFWANHNSSDYVNWNDAEIIDRKSYIPCE